MGSETAAAVSTEQFSFPDRTFVRITVAGLITRQHSPHINPSVNRAGTPYPSLDADGEWLSGYSIRSGFIFTDFSGTNRMNLQVLGPAPNTPSTGTLTTYSRVGTVRGTGPIRRWAFQQPTGISSTDCWVGPCVIATGGSQTVRIELSAAQLSLTATPDSVARGTPVTFVASSSIANLTVLEWKWWPESVPSNTSTEACGTAKTCIVTVHESGTMWVRARAGGIPQSVQAASAAVEAPTYGVVQCPTGDSLVDAPAVRAMLRALMDSSMGHNPRREFAGALFRDNNGDERWVIDFANPNNSCTSSRFTAGTPAGWEPVFFAQTHPYSIGNVTCAGTRYVEGLRGGIPSARDWAGAANSGFSIPYAVIDRDSIAVMRPGPSSATELLSDGTPVPVPDSIEFAQRNRGHPRAGAQCTRP